MSNKTKPILLLTLIVVSLFPPKYKVSSNIFEVKSICVISC